MFFFSLKALSPHHQEGHQHYDASRCACTTVGQVGTAMKNAKVTQTLGRERERIPKQRPTQSCDAKCIKSNPS